MYLHDKKTGLVFPFPIFHLIWKYKKQLLVFGILSQVIAPFAWALIPKPQNIIDAEKKESLRLEACTKAKDIDFCKNFGN